MKKESFVDERRPCAWPGCGSPSIVSVVSVDVCTGHFYTCSDIVDTFRSENGAKSLVLLLEALEIGCTKLGSEGIEGDLDAAWSIVRPHLQSQPEAADDGK